MRLICVERNRKNYADLVERVTGFGESVTAFSGNFARHVKPITETIGDAPALIILDPIGLKAITADACSGLLERKGKTDLFVIVDFGIVHRTRGQLLADGEPNPQVPGAEANAANIDAFYRGSRRWRCVEEGRPVEERERDYLRIYFDDVLGDWFDYCSACPVRGSYGASPEYWIVNAASHIDAYLLMNDEIAKIDKELYLRTYGEGALPDLVDQLYQELTRKRIDALERDVLQHVQEAGPAGVGFGDIVLNALDRHFGQAEVGKWAGDYARIVRKLIDDGHLVREKGRLAAAFDRSERITAGADPTFVG